MRKSFYCITVILMLINTSITYAQRGFRIGEEMKAPSTDTWNFVKQGEIGASLHTGTVNLSIPIFTYSDNDFELPITLDYSSNGLVGNMRAGILGPDWTLNAGGSISVEVRGMQDFNNEVEAQCYYNYHLADNPGENGSLWRYTNIIHTSLELGTMSPEIIYIPDPNKTIIDYTDKYDAEPDIFHFNFMGYSGSFHLGRNKSIYVYNTNGNNKLLHIDIAKENNHVVITFTDKDGYKYLFYESNSDRVQDKEGELKTEIAYKLTKIISPNNRDISFEYDYINMKSYRPASFCYTGNVMDMDNASSPEVSAGSNTDLSISESTSEVAILSAIYIDSKKLASFNYESLPDGTKDQHAKDIFESLEEFDECIRLKEIIISNPLIDRDTLKKACFSYSATLGARTNYLTLASISGEGEYSFNYYNMDLGIFPPIGTRKIDHWGYYNNLQGNNFLKIVSQNQSTLEESLNSSVRNPQPNYAIYGMLKKITYPTGGYTSIEYEPHDYGFAVRKIADDGFSMHLVEENGVCGGLRVKKIINHSDNDSIMNSKTFVYTKDNRSSGILLYFPKYWIAYSASTERHFLENSINFYSNNLIHHGGSHIEYECVTQINRDESKQTYYFSNSRMSSHYRDCDDYTDVIPERTALYGSWNISNGNRIKSIVMPAISKKAERGKLLKQEFYKAGNDIPEKTVTFTYDTSSMNIPMATYPVYLVRRFGYGHIPIDNYKLSNTTEQENFSGSMISKEENVTYNSYYQPAQKATIRSNGEIEITRYEYASDYANNGGIYSTMKLKHLLSYPISEMSYVADLNGTETLVAGKKYSYGLFDGIVKLSCLKEYNTQNKSWQTTITYTKYDRKGNILETINANGLYTSYVWGYSGLYMIAKIENTKHSDIASIVGNSPLPGCLSTEQISSIKANCPNADITTYEYKPLVGVSKIVNPNGETFTYKYNESGKLMGIYNSKGEKVEEALYSTDNKQ